MSDPKIYGLGYKNLMEAKDVAKLSEKLNAVVYDIRIKRSDGDEEFTANKVRFHVGDRYLHATGLSVEDDGNLLDPAPWYDWIQDDINAGKSVILFCSCADPDKCHRNTIREAMFEQSETSGQELTVERISDLLGWEDEPEQEKELGLLGKLLGK